MNWWPWRKETKLTGSIRGFANPDPEKVAGAARELIENMIAAGASAGHGAIMNDAGEPIFVIAIATSAEPARLLHRASKRMHDGRFSTRTEVRT